MRKLVRSTIFCSSFLPYHIFSFVHVLHCLRIHSFFEYNKSLCENVGSARSVDRNSKIIVIINTECTHKIAGEAYVIRESPVLVWDLDHLNQLHFLHDTSRCTWWLVEVQ